MSKWISVKDRLPDAPEQGCTMVIVANYSETRKKYFVGAAEFQRGNFYDRYNERMHIDDPYWPITHWMPLPDAPGDSDD